jgi:hypothetical protein
MINVSFLKYDHFNFNLYNFYLKKFQPKHVHLVQAIY